MGGAFLSTVDARKKRALKALGKEIEAFKKKWDADWWQMRIKPLAERITPNDEGWEHWLEFYYKEHPWTSSIPEALWIASCWIHA